MAGLLEITTRIGCKVACRFCPQSKFLTAYAKRGGATMLDMATFRTCLGKVPRKVEIVFSGFSEPWLNPACTQMLLHAHETGHRISVFTTLVGMPADDVALIERIPFKRFVVHLPSQEGAETIKIDQEYLATLQRICTSRIRPSFLVHGENIAPELKRALTVQIAKTGICSRAGNLDSAVAPARRAGVVQCKMALRGNVLLPNGDVTLCCMDWGLQHVLGNLLSMEYADLFTGTEFRRVQAGVRDESSEILCRYCYDLARASLRQRLFWTLYDWYKRSPMRPVVKGCRQAIRKLRRRTPA